jgi:general stress protein CsbA
VKSASGIPLLIGVSGHRDLGGAERVAEVRSRVERFFEMLERRYPHTELVVYSALAQGADQLVAEVAIARGISLVAVLPMPRQLYEEEFSGPALSLFRDLIGRAERAIELPLLFGTKHEDLRSDPNRISLQAQEQYAALGDFLAVRTQLLLAVWNGVESPALGGTAWTIRAKLTGKLRADAERLDPIELGLVYVIPAAGETPTATPLPAEGFVAADDVDRYFGALRDIDVYNAHLAAAPRGNDALAEARDTADALAIRYHRILARTRNILAALVLALVLIFAIYSELSRTPFVLAIYLVTLLVGAGVWTWQRRAYIEKRFFEYRALAEALRIQHVWVTSGLPYSVEGAYLRKHAGELHWIRLVLRGYAADGDVVSAIAARRAARPAPGRPEDYPAAREWIAEQSAYFQIGAVRRTRTVKRLRAAARILYGIGLATAAGTGVAGYFQAAPLIEHALVFAMAVSPAFAGIILSWIEQTGIEDEARQTTRMARLFESARRDWDEHPTLRTALMSELGKEAVYENADWLLMHRSHPLEAPLSPG